MIVSPETSGPARKVLVVCTFGGATHAAPMLEISKILHERGYVIELACLEESRKLLKNYPFITKIEVIARGMDPEVEAAMFRRMDEATDGFKNAMYHLDKMWTETYRALDDRIARDRPDFIFADAMDQGAIDMAKKYDIPLASNEAQLPKHAAPASYVPGIPGLQQKHLTSEHASLRDRFYEEFWKFKFIFSIKDHIISNGKLRKSLGAPPNSPSAAAHHLMLVNSCWGIEQAKELPPLIVPCGPILSDEFSGVGDLKEMLDTHSRVVLIVFGSRVNLPVWRIQRLIRGLQSAMDLGYIDGVIWGLRVNKVNQKGLSSSQDEEASLNGEIDYNAILENRNPHWRITPWVSQRGVLDHPSTALFISHCGGSSTMEAIYHGTPVLSMGVFGDQKANSKRLKAAGVALELHKDEFTANEVCHKVGTIVMDRSGSFGRNVLRMKRIATIASKRKYLAADMIEEVLFDHEGRFGTQDNVDNEKVAWLPETQQGTRPMHLETAGARMSLIKAKNIDMWMVGLLTVASVVTIFVLLIRLLCLILLG
ncbi:hypothetical protein H2200_007839 [Cladophialophora chaetospira]|uniref:UDP-glucosyl transferase family protein n=1 Tax=Cladophialophora chaetospira TaxID=386627 RepID=A0AA38X6L9_9EURO|nr:hypothetical protein H2200_007839 [Cladophialophora chaetospira]